jgi:hypothetical protein
MWLVLTPPDIDVCMKDPGHTIDMGVRGDIAVFVAVLLGQARWSAKLGQEIIAEGEPKLIALVPAWFNL